jgi:hypothetical protein
MYPAQALLAGLYSAADLPDQVGIWDNNEGQLAGVLQKSGAEYIYTGSGIFFIERLAVVNGLWAAYSPFFEEFVFTGKCLFPGEFTDNFLLKDQFANSYTVTGPPGGPVIVTRQGLCLWTGLDTCGNRVELQYFNDADFWHITWTNYGLPPEFEPCTVFNIVGVEKWPYAEGGDGINTPVGNYSFGSVS